MNATKMTVIMLFTAVSLIARTFTAADDIIGTWYTGSKEAKVTIFKTGNTYYGKISWMKEPLDATGKPKTDNKNSDKSQHTKPILNLLILKSFEYNTAQKKWENGTIYDPKSGKTYSCNITMPNANTLEVRGYMGISLVGRTDTWTKAE
jgi:uncharacterized protein (DUF2147 family)